MFSSCVLNVQGLFGQPANTPVGGLFGSTQTASSAGNGFGSTQSSFGTNTQVRSSAFIWYG